MDKAQAIEFLNGIVPVDVSMVTLDPASWADFKASMLALLTADPGVDPKYKAALEAANVKIDEANAIVDEALE